MVYALIQLGDQMAEQFDLLEARNLRDEGIERVSSHNTEFLVTARKAARYICSVRGECTTDDVRRLLDIEPDHPNAWGSVFRKGFVWTGKYRQSEVVSRRGGMQRVWRLP